jgi:hypothetical protein
VILDAIESYHIFIKGVLRIFNFTMCSVGLVSQFFLHRIHRIPHHCKQATNYPKGADKAVDKKLPSGADKWEGKVST